eukprot:PhF_6_TR39587/c0_g1_i2/m.58671
MARNRRNNNKSADKREFNEDLQDRLNRPTRRGPKLCFNCKQPGHMIDSQGAKVVLQLQATRSRDRGVPKTPPRAPQMPQLQATWSLEPQLSPTAPYGRWSWEGQCEPWCTRMGLSMHPEK